MYSLCQVSNRSKKIIFFNKNMPYKNTLTAKKMELSAKKYQICLSSTPIKPTSEILFILYCDVYYALFR